MAPFSAIFDPVRRVLQVGHSDRAVVGGVRYLDIVFPLPTLARNRLGSNGRFPLRFIAGAQSRKQLARGLTRKHSRPHDGSVVAAAPLSLAAELLPPGRQPRDRRDPDA